MRTMVFATLIVSLVTLPTAVPAADAGPQPQQVSATTSATTSFPPQFREELGRIVSSHRGSMGLSVRHLETGETVEINGDTTFPTASTIKLAVMCTVFDELCRPGGKFKGYYDTRPYDAATSTGGAGFLQNYKDGTKVELKELLHLMITVSDNIATNMLVEWVGIDTVNKWLERHGFAATRMLATIGGRIVWNDDLRREWGLGMTTPNEMRRLLEMIVRGEAGTTSATDEMLRLMGHQYFDSGIAAEVPPTVWTGSKSGSLNAMRADNAIVASPNGTYVLSVYTANNADKRWLYANEGDASIRAVSRAAWKHFNPGSQWQRPGGTERF